MRIELYYCKDCKEWVEVELNNPLDTREYPSCDICGKRVYETGDLEDIYD